MEQYMFLHSYALYDSKEYSTNTLYFRYSQALWNTVPLLTMGSVKPKWQKRVNRNARRNSQLVCIEIPPQLDRARNLTGTQC